VGSAYYEVSPKFGVAGGPDEVRLTDAGLDRIAKVAARLSSYKHVDALREMEGLDYMAMEEGLPFKPKLTEFGKKYLGGTINALRTLGYINLRVVPDSQFRHYEITPEGREALKKVDEEEQYLKDRITSELGLTKSSDKIPGGLADKKKPNVSEAKIKRGQKVAMEAKKSMIYVLWGNLEKARKNKNQLGLFGSGQTTSKHQTVLEYGPRGGHIIGRDAKGNPIYAGTAQARRFVMKKKKAQAKAKPKQEKLSETDPDKVTQEQMDKMFPVKSKVEDWGTLRGRKQGKRAGGQVMGGMADST